MVTAIERRKKKEEAGVLEDDAIPISKNGSTKWSTQRFKTTETMANSIGKWEKSTIKNIPSKKAPPKNVTTGIYSFIHRGWMKLKYQLKRTTNEMPDLRIENNTEMYRYTKKKPALMSSTFGFGECEFECDTESQSFPIRINWTLSDESFTGKIIYRFALLPNRFRNIHMHRNCAHIKSHPLNGVLCTNMALCFIYTMILIPFLASYIRFVCIIDVFCEHLNRSFCFTRKMHLKMMQMR